MNTDLDSIEYFGLTFYILSIFTSVLWSVTDFHAQALSGIIELPVNSQVSCKHVRKQKIVTF